jgi:hypothetical protein
MNEPIFNYASKLYGTGDSEMDWERDIIDPTYINTSEMDWQFVRELAEEFMDDLQNSRSDTIEQAFSTTLLDAVMSTVYGEKWDR